MILLEDIQLDAVINADYLDYLVAYEELIGTPLWIGEDELHRLYSEEVCSHKDVVSCPWCGISCCPECEIGCSVCGLKFAPIGEVDV